jgi:membrane-associated protease RseP (regulator of RpoE activity)
MIAAKLCKCAVPEFAVGFGHTLYSKKIGDTTYKLNILPLGGYVKLGSELEYSRSKFAFTNKTYSQKVFISMAGILVNVVTGGLAYYLGWHFQNTFLYAFGFYSVLIGLSNALPIPALDGSYPVFFLLEKKLGKKRTYALMKSLFAKWFKWLMILNILTIPYIVWLFYTGKIL